MLSSFQVGDVVRWYVFTIFFFCRLAAEPLPVEVLAEAAIVINADTQAVLYEKNARETHYPASLTKMVTALYTVAESGANLDNLALAEQDTVGFVTEGAKRLSNYTMPAHYVEFGADHMGIHPGERIKLRDLVYGLMLSSANDAANVIAEHVGGSISLFMKEINAYVHSLGMQSTHFVNPHGLHHPDHVTTAYDLALLTSAAVKNPLFCEIVGTTHYRRPQTDKQVASTLVQSNLLLRKGKYYYSKAIGVKTGYTSKAQHCFAAAARYQGRTLVVILLKSADRGAMFSDAVKLFEAAFNQPKLEKTLLNAGPQQMFSKIPGSRQKMQAALEVPLTIRYYPAEEQPWSAHAEWLEVDFPIEAGQVIGELTLNNTHGYTLQSVPLVAARQVRPSVIEQLFDSLKAMSSAAWGFLFILVAGSCWILLRLSPTRRR